MEPVVMAITHTAAAFEETLPAFVAQILFSRNKNLNRQAKTRALALEEAELGRLHDQMINNESINSHYKILGANKELIQCLDQKIDDTLKKKFDLIQWYARTVLKESSSIVNGEEIESEVVNNRLNQEKEVERELKFYDSELEHLQRRRAHLWDADTEWQDQLLSREKKRNGQLDASFRRYSGLFEKIYLHHDGDGENTGQAGIEAKKVLKKITVTSQFLMSYFTNPSKDVSCNQAREVKARCEVAELENAINGKDYNDSSFYLDPVNSELELSSNYHKNHLATPTV